MIVPPKRYVWAFAASAACLALASCDLAGPPERFYDEGARPPIVAPIDVADLRPGQHLAGTVRFTLALDSLAGRVERVVLFVNGAHAGERHGPPYWFDLNTDVWEEGPLELGFGVYARGARQGLLSGLPTHLLGPYPVVVDRRPPTPVEVAGIAWEGDRPRVTWTRNEDANFRAYIVFRLRRGDRDMSAHSFYPGTVVATITDRNTTGFLDAPAPAEYGASTRFAVVAWNGEGAPQPERWAAAQYGKAVEVPSVSAGVAHPARAEVYGLGGYSFRVLSLRTGTLAHTIPQDGWTWRFEPPSLSPAGAVLLLPRTPAFPETRWTILRLDPDTFAERGRFEADQAYGPFAVSDDGLAYAFRNRQHDALLGAFDSNTGAFMSQLGGFLPETRALALSADGRALTAFAHGQMSGARLYRVDVSGAAPVVAATRAFEDFRSASVGPGGQVYVWQLNSGANHRVEVLDGASLRTEQVLDVQPLGGDWVIEVKEAAGSVFVVSNVPDTQGIHPLTMISQHRLPDLETVETWRFRAIVTDVFPTPASRELAVLTTRDEFGSDLLQLWTLPLQP